MEYHFSEHINNIHDFPSWRLNLKTLLVTVLSGQVRNKKKTHTHKHTQEETKWCTEQVEGGRLFTKLALVSENSHHHKSSGFLQ